MFSFHLIIIWPSCVVQIKLICLETIRFTSAATCKIKQMTVKPLLWPIRCWISWQCHGLLAGIQQSQHFHAIWLTVRVWSKLGNCICINLLNLNIKQTFSPLKQIKKPLSKHDRADSTFIVSFYRERKGLDVETKTPVGQNNINLEERKKEGWSLCTDS